MNHEIHFETPENVRVSYRTAGPGTRFVAWFVDNILLTIAAIVIFFVVLTAVERAGVDVGAQGSEALLIIFGIFYLGYALSGWLYFGLSELLLRGQTFGKRQMGIRVVKADGFALDHAAILLRTIFRAIDNLPPMWIVPLWTEKGQRLGDLVAGTIVVTDQHAALGTLREELIARAADQPQFRFDAAVLSRARPQDVLAVEKILQAIGKLSAGDRQSLLGRLVRPLAARLAVECPAEADWLTFLEEFLAAEYRRQYRKLG
ncbi:MAG TPA: RDD family protein [Pirellulales bacterium]